jgi:hypothetical protein
MIYAVSEVIDNARWFDNDGRKRWLVDWKASAVRSQPLNLLLGDLEVADDAEAADA